MYNLGLPKGSNSNKQGVIQTSYLLVPFKSRLVRRLDGTIHSIDRYIIYENDAAAELTNYLPF